VVSGGSGTPSCSTVVMEGAGRCVGEEKEGKIVRREGKRSNTYNYIYTYIN